MKKLLVSTFMIAALVFTASTNVNAQTETKIDNKVIQKKGVTKGNNVVAPKKAVVTKEINTNTPKQVTKANVVPAKIEPINKKATMPKKKNVTTQPVKGNTVSLKEKKGKK